MLGLGSRVRRVHQPAFDLVEGSGLRLEDLLSTGRCLQLVVCVYAGEWRVHAGVGVGTFVCVRVGRCVWGKGGWVRVVCLCGSRTRSSSRLRPRVQGVGFRVEVLYLAQCIHQLVSESHSPHKTVNSTS